MFSFNKKENEYNDKNQLIDKTKETFANPFHKISTSCSTPRHYCRILGSISLALGIILVVLSILFKLQSRVYISKALDADCPATCVTTCYRFMPFPIACESRATCNDRCLSVGISKAIIYSVFFTLFISIGGMLVLIQMLRAFIEYCCYDYCDYRNK